MKLEKNPVKTDNYDISKSKPSKFVATRLNFVHFSDFSFRKKLNGTPFVCKSAMKTENYDISFSSKLVGLRLNSVHFYDFSIERRKI